ncbi:MAG TPA: hypothetical protein HPQ00_07440 [Magnetococcales bacterium]|nr:hypothetical protein [Magnetococcales bacterium]
MAIFGATVLSAIAVGIRILWRYFYPKEGETVGVEKSLWFHSWNGRVFLVMLVLMFVVIGWYRMTTVQQTPQNLERPPSREVMEKAPVSSLDTLKK